MYIHTAKPRQRALNLVFGRRRHLGDICVGRTYCPRTADQPTWSLSIRKSNVPNCGACQVVKQSPTHAHCVNVLAISPRLFTALSNQWASRSWGRQGRHLVVQPGPAPLVLKLPPSGDMIRNSGAPGASPSVFEQKQAISSLPDFPWPEITNILLFDRSSRRKCVSKHSKVNVTAVEIRNRATVPKTTLSCCRKPWLRHKQQRHLSLLSPSTSSPRCAFPSPVDGPEVRRRTMLIRHDPDRPFPPCPGPQHRPVRRPPPLPPPSTASLVPVRIHSAAAPAPPTLLSTRRS